MKISSYDRDAPVPEEGSTWIWRPNEPHARQRIEVTEVKWNGEEWWVKSKNLPTKPLKRKRSFGWPIYVPRVERVGDEAWNDLSCFWQAVRPSLSHV